jgi:hypothetical protein
MFFQVDFSNVMRFWIELIVCPAPRQILRIKDPNKRNNAPENFAPALLPIAAF